MLYCLKTGVSHWQKIFYQWLKASDGLIGPIESPPKKCYYVVTLKHRKLLYVSRDSCQLRTSHVRTLFVFSSNKSCGLCFSVAFFPIVMIIWQSRFQFKDSSCVKSVQRLCDTKNIPDYICFPPSTCLTSSTRYVTQSVSLRRFSPLNIQQRKSRTMIYSSLT